MSGWTAIRPIHRAYIIINIRLTGQVRIEFVTIAQSQEFQSLLCPLGIIQYDIRQARRRGNNGPQAL